jgi:DNA-binding transcriptional ArsR family regulator
MNRAETLAIVKALADESRLKILDSLAEGPQCVEALAASLNLSSPTISFHCKKLEKAGLVSKKKERYYVMFQTNFEAFTVTLKELVSFGAAKPLGKDYGMRQETLEFSGNQMHLRRSIRPDKTNASASDGYDDYCTITF